MLRVRAGTQPRRGDVWHVVGLLLLLALVGSGLATTERARTSAVAVQTLSSAEGAAPGTLQLRFTLPARESQAAPWVVWVPRLSQHAIWLEAHGWSSAERDFFAPDPVEGVLPGGYVFMLPLRWEGPIEATLHAQPGLDAGLQPRVMSAIEAARLEQAAAVGSAVIYASLLMLALLSLSLYAAARDRVFLTLFVCANALVLMLAAVNGHLYGLPGLQLMAHWGTAGLWALVFVFLATWVRLIQQYVGQSPGATRLDRASDIAFWSMLGLAALCLVGLALPTLPWRQVAFVCWLATGGGSLLLFAGAVRRRVVMAWPLTLLLLVLIAVTLSLELLADMHRLGPLLTRFFYQGALVLFLTLCAIGLVHRISEYREQRDRDQKARIDSERRVLRETARTELVNGLQSKLRQVGQGEVAGSGFQVMATHLLPLLPVSGLVVVAEGYHGSSLLLVEPGDSHDAVVAELRERALVLRRQAAAGLALQQPVTVDSVACTEAVIPLRMKAPAWGVLLLRRAGQEGLAPDEMALASEFCRTTQMQVDQAIAAIQLRQSAELDALTGSLNRRSVDQWLVRCVDEADRDGQPLSVLFVDLDRFKLINDRHGHAAGDQCLRAVAGALAGALEEGDIFGRYGGEEFVVILPGRTGAAARQVGERLRAAVERQVTDWEGQPLRLTVSVGVATRLDGDRSPQELIERADKALYAAKRAGRNCVHVAPAVFT
ncbi:GGDEF domain-containing protein [Luteimonas qiangzhengi]|uniref:GGDEF domain-containing protein n=1 Tax=Luteimonas sp. MJ146 TaxID=3129240 RepID=UPI0031BA5CC5